MKTLKLNGWVVTLILINLCTSSCHKETVAYKTPKAIQRIINKQEYNYDHVDEHSYKNTQIYLFWSRQGYVQSSFEIYDNKGKRITKDEQDSTLCITSSSNECHSYMFSLTYKFKSQIKYNRIIWKRS